MILKPILTLKSLMLERHQLQQLYQYGLSLTRHPHDAHDLLQSALEKWVRHNKPGHNPEAYIRKIMRNHFIDDCRRHNLIPFESLEADAPLLMDEQSLEQQHIDSDMVEQLLEHLNAAEREVLFLWAVMEYTASEIAGELKTSRGTILSRLFRVKKKAQQLASTLETENPLPLGVNP